MNNQQFSQISSTNVGAQVALFIILEIIVILIGNILGLLNPILPVFFIFIFSIISILISISFRIVNQWSRAIVLRLGKFQAVKGPGLFFLIPVVDSISSIIDLRVITSSFKAESTLTIDNVAVTVDAVLFWKVIDPMKAALEIADFRSSVTLASQTALRDIIGQNDLSTMLSKRDLIDTGLKELIDKRTSPWGIEVISVEIKDVAIPDSLQAAMSMQAQAERERQARVILGDSERQIAEKFVEAAKIYENNPTALHLRAMNMLYEGLKEKGALMLIPSSALDTMNLGSITGLASVAETQQKV